MQSRNSTDDEPAILARAAGLFRAAALDACLTELVPLSSPEAAILRARVHQRRYQTDLGIDALATIDEGKLPPLTFAELSIVRGYLLLISGLHDEANACLHDACGIVLKSDSAAAEAEYYVVRSISYYVAGNLEEAYRAADHALHVNLELNSRSKPYFETLATLRIRALQIQGIILASRELYHEQGRIVRIAITEAKSERGFDLWAFATMLGDLAFYVRDFHSEKDADLLQTLIIDARWPPQLDYVRFEIHRALGEFYAVRGDVAAARRAFDESLAVAPTPGWIALAHANLASFLSEIGEERQAREHIQTAIEVASPKYWSKQIRERYALLQISYVAATFDVSKAEELLGVFRGPVSEASPLAIDLSDRRVRAYLFRAEGAIALEHGDLDKAIERFRNAFEIWNDIGMEWLAATVAFALFRLTNERRFHTLLRREISIRPTSTLAKNFLRNPPAGS